MPKKGGRARYNAVASILEALDASTVFGYHHVSIHQKTALELFRDLCQNQEILMELKFKQLITYLLFLKHMNYTPSTVKYRWRPLFKILQTKKIPVAPEVLDLYDVVYENAKEKPDAKLPVSDELLQQQVAAIDKFLTPGYENVLAKACLTTAWVGQLRVSEYTSTYVEAG